jgi:ribosome-binding factor A
MLRIPGQLSAASRMAQKLNEKLMRCEIEAISELVNDSKVSRISESEATGLVQGRTLAKARRMMGISKKGMVNQDKVKKYHVNVSESSYDNVDVDSDPIQPRHDQLERYESMRGTPRFQDLTHPEARRVQELFERKKMLNRKLKWLKNNQLLDPVKEVNKEMKQKEREERRERTSLFPIPQDKDPLMERKIKDIEFKMERDTAISRARTELRKQKLERSAAMTTSTPDIGSVVTDPLKRHLNRRRVRVSLLMQQYLEELFTCNTAQIILDHLGGAALSVEKVTAPSTRGVHDVYMRLSSNHDQAWVQKKLDILTPKIRSQLAVRVNYGYTPELKFHILDDVDKFRKSRLMRLADQAKREVDKSLNKHFMTEMNWK